MGRELTIPIGDPALDMTLPTQANRASKFFAFDASGLPLAVAGSVGGYPTTPYMGTLLDDADAATARGTLQTWKRKTYSQTGGSSYTILDTDSYETLIFEYNAGAPATITINLPTVADNIDRILTIKSIGYGETYKIIIDGEGTEEINGTLTWELNGDKQWVTLQAVGGTYGWQVIGNDGPIYTFTDTSNQYQTAPGAGTWYNPGSMSITLPAGVYDLSFLAVAEARHNNNVSGSDVRIALSTSNSSVSDTDLVGYVYQANNHAEAFMYVDCLLNIYKRRVVSASTIFYLICMTNIATASGYVGIYGSQVPTRVIAKRVA
jgi:hypothetical protein